MLRIVEISIFKSIVSYQTVFFVFFNTKGRIIKHENKTKPFLYQERIYVV